jgi:hypothetical protein
VVCSIRPRIPSTRWSGRGPAEGAGEAHPVLVRADLGGRHQGGSPVCPPPTQCTPRGEIRCSTPAVRRTGPRLGGSSPSRTGESPAPWSAGMVEGCGRTERWLPIDPGRAHTADRTMTSAPGRRLHSPGASPPLGRSMHEGTRADVQRGFLDRSPGSVVIAGSVRPSPRVNGIPMG